MEWVIGIGVVLLIGVFVLPALAGVGLAGAEAKGRKSATEGADAVLDRMFATDVATVSYDSRPYSSIPATTVIEGAIQRGWTLIHDDRGMLLFSRTS